MKSSFPDRKLFPRKAEGAKFVSQCSHSLNLEVRTPGSHPEGTAGARRSKGRRRRRRRQGWEERGGRNEKAARDLHMGSRSIT